MLAEQGRVHPVDVTDKTEHPENFLLGPQPPTGDTRMFAMHRFPVELHRLMERMVVDLKGRGQKVGLQDLGIVLIREALMARHIRY